MKCKICDNKKNNRKIIIREWMMNTNKKFNYFQCSKCGCIQILKIPKNLNDFYPKNYYSMSEEFSNEKGIKKKIKIKIFKSALKGGFFYKFISFFTSFTKLNFFKYIKINKKSKILDVGCGKGSIIYYLNDVGYKKTIGIDTFLDENKIRYLNGATIYKKKLEDLNEKFDLIFLSHSFEHMEKPLEVLKKLSKLLNKNGCLIINIPIADSYAYKKYKEHWFQLDAPRHLFIHTKKSMEILTKKVNLKIQNKKTKPKPKKIHPNQEL